MHPKAFIFDLDGTLIDSVHDIADAMNHVLLRYGYPVHDVEAYRSFIGDGITNLVSRALPAEVSSDERIQMLVRQMKDEYRLHYMAKTALYPGMDAVLDLLTEKGIKKCILSNKPDLSTNQIVSKLLSKWTFDAVKGARDDMPIKPDPALALEIAWEISVLPHNIIYVGDSAVDIQTALNAGMLPIGVSWGYRPAAELETAGATAVFHNTGQLLEYCRGVATN